MKKTISLLNLIALLILIVPYSYSYSHTDEMEPLYWIPNYIFQEVDLFLFYMPILILTIGYQINKKNIWKKTFLILMLIIFLLYFLGAIASLSFPIQDYSPGLGNLLLLTLFPLTVIMYKNDQHERNKKTTANTI